MRIVKPSEFQPTVRLANYIVTRPDANWPNRKIPDYELIYVVSGRFSYETPAEGQTILRPGEVLCIPPLEFHTFRRLDRGRQAIISCVHGEVVQDGTRAAGDYAVEPVPRRVTETKGEAEIHRAFKRCAEVFNAYGRYRRVLVETIAREIWVRLASRWVAGKDRPFSLRLSRMLAFLRTHLSEPVSRRDLARAFHITPEHVNALFKKELGISPTSFVHRERVLLGYHLMRDEGLSVKEAAARVGFCDAFHFSKVFKRIMSFPPRQLVGWQQVGRKNASAGLKSPR